MSVKYEKIVAQDLNLGTGQVEVTMPAGGTAMGDRIGLQTFRALAFIARNGGGQDIVGGAEPDDYNIVVLDNEKLDTFDSFDLDTGRFTPLIPGLYSIDAYLSVEAYTGKFFMAFYKNDEWVIEAEAIRINDGAQLHLSMITVMDGVGDYITLRVFHNDGTNTRTIDLAQMSGTLIGNVE